MFSFKRTDRVKDQIKKEIADILMKKIKDPRIGFVTVTDVEVTKDLRSAKVYVSIYESSQPNSQAGEIEKRTLAGIRSATGYIRSELSKRIRLRYIPDIVFEIDRSLERGSRVLKILEEIKKSTDEP